MKVSSMTGRYKGSWSHRQKMKKFKRDIAEIVIATVALSTAVWLVLWSLDLLSWA